MPESVLLTKMTYYASLSKCRKWIPRRDRKWDNSGGTSYGTDSILFIITTKIPIRIYFYLVGRLGDICLGNIEPSVCVQGDSPNPPKAGVSEQAEAVISRSLGGSRVGDIGREGLLNHSKENLSFQRGPLLLIKKQPVSYEWLSHPHGCAFGAEITRKNLRNVGSNKGMPEACGNNTRSGA